MADIEEKVARHLGCDTCSISEISIRLVRDVAPNKRMMRVTFRVPESVAYSDKHGAESEKLQGGPAEPELKRPRLDI